MLGASSMLLISKTHARFTHPVVSRLQPAIDALSAQRTAQGQRKAAQQVVARVAHGSQARCLLHWAEYTVHKRHKLQVACRC